MTGVGLHGCLLAVDPGGTTGWVLMGTGGQVLDWGEEPDQQAFLTMAWQLLVDDALYAVVCERWVTMRGRAFTNEPTAQEIIGALRWQCEYTGVVFQMQGAADAKAFGTKERMSRYPDVGRGAAGHAKMALRHALLFRETRGEWLT